MELKKRQRSVKKWFFTGGVGKVKNKKKHSFVAIIEQSLHLI